MGLSRSERLRAGKAWVSQWKGKNIIKEYAQHFGVDRLCAVGDLKSLLRSGVRIDPVEADRVNRKVAHQQRQRAARRREKLNKQPEQLLVESDERFADIVGRTAWGFPFGVTWEEMGEEPATAPHDLTGEQPNEDAKKKSKGFLHNGEAA